MSFYRIKDIFSYIRILQEEILMLPIRVDIADGNTWLLCYGITVVMSVRQS